MKKKDELKLCPFCGSKPMMWIGKRSKPDKSIDYYVQCSHCGNRTMVFNSKVWGYPKVEVVKRWNSRIEEKVRPTFWKKGTIPSCPIDKRSK